MPRRGPTHWPVKGESLNDYTAKSAAMPALRGSPKSLRKLINDTYEVKCQRCGSFSITEETLKNRIPDEKKYQLSAYCRRTHKGSISPTITTKTVDDFIRSLPQYTVPEKLDNLLEHLGRMSPEEFGKPSDFDPDTDYPLLIMRGPAEARSYVAVLASRDYVTQTNPPVVRMRGWERLEEIKRSGRQSDQAFVAMWFDKSRDEVYENAIKPAIIDAGWKPLRIDRHEHVNRIDDEIIGQVRRSRFMVADFTGQRPGVYFEAGMVLGLGRTVIWMCNKSELEGDKPHFDVRQYNFIAYESLPDAKKRLYRRIVAEEGEGPCASSIVG